MLYAAIQITICYSKTDDLCRQRLKYNIQLFPKLQNLIKKITSTLQVSVFFSITQVK